MKNLALVAVLCVAVITGCKKKEDTAPAAGSGSAAMAGSGSGSDTAMAGSGSATAPAAGSGSAMAAGSGSAADSGSAAAGSGSATAAGSGSGSAAAPAEDKNWDCKKLCKLAHKCKDKDFHSEKECDDDCTKVMKDTTGKYTNASIQGVPFYSCANKATDCAAEKKCNPMAK